MTNNDLATEWTLLQNQYDSYEKYSLVIKLVNVALFSVLVAMNSSDLLILAVVLVLWGQDAIWKTFQSRIESHLLILEKSLKKAQADTQISAFQFNSLFIDKRPSSMGLMIEYAKQALRPTVAFPHILLIVILLANHLLK
ncbi:hypothetical protein AAD001_17265 [Colwelliaceae bacterium 6471]